MNILKRTTKKGRRGGGRGIEENNRHYIAFAARYIHSRYVHKCSGVLMITFDIRLQISAQNDDEEEGKGPICPPLPAQYHPTTPYTTTTTPQLHKTATDYNG